MSRAEATDSHTEGSTLTSESFPHSEPEKEPVPGNCPACGAHNLARYPVLAVGGWFTVVKCQRCLHSVTREPWNRLGWINLGGVEL